MRSALSSLRFRASTARTASPARTFLGRFFPGWPDTLSFDSNFEGGNIMLHLIWYIIVGLIAGFVAKSVTHLFSRPKEGAQFHPAGIIVSILGALLVLFLWHKYKLHIPAG